jgi:hypothetical protein
VSGFWAGAGSVILVALAVVVGRSVGHYLTRKRWGLIRRDLRLADRLRMYRDLRRLERGLVREERKHTVRAAQRDQWRSS